MKTGIAAAPPGAAGAHRQSWRLPDGFHHGISRSGAPGIQASIDDMGIARCLEQVEHSGAAIFGWGSWMDAGTANAALRRFATLKNAQRVVIGAWEHGGQCNASPYLPSSRPVSPSLPAQWAEMIHFYRCVPSKCRR